MKYSFLFCLLLLLCSPTRAQDASPDDVYTADLLLVMAAIGKIEWLSQLCSAQFPEQKKRLDVGFRSWKERHLPLYDDIRFRVGYQQLKKNQQDAGQKNQPDPLHVQVEFNRSRVEQEYLRRGKSAFRSVCQKFDLGKVEYDIERQFAEKLRSIRAIKVEPPISLGKTDKETLLATSIFQPVNLISQTTTIPPTPQRAQIIWKSCPKPEYPAKALRENKQGTVQITFTISVEGLATDSKIIQSSGSRDLDRVTRQTLIKCQFVPAKQYGEPVESEVTVEYVWALN